MIQKVVSAVGAWFGIDGLDPRFTMDGLAEPGEYTPKKDPLYVFTKAMLRNFVAFWKSGDVCMRLTGLRGTGKTSVVAQFHAYTHNNLVTYSCDRDTTIADLIGSVLVTGEGKWDFIPGPLLIAAENGWSICLDEYNLLNPAVASGLNNLLEGGQYFVPQLKRMIQPQPGFRVFCTGNPPDAGAGHLGRHQQDGANDDRAWWIQVPYLKPEVEQPLVEAVLTRYGADPAGAALVAKGMVECANKIRKLYVGASTAKDAIETTMSTRVLRRWAKLSRLFHKVEDLGLQPIHYALERALTNADLQPASKLAIHSVVEQVFGIKYQPSDEI